MWFDDGSNTKNLVTLTAALVPSFRPTVSVPAVDSVNNNCAFVGNVVPNDTPTRQRRPRSCSGYFSPIGWRRRPLLTWDRRRGRFRNRTLPGSRQTADLHGGRGQPRAPRVSAPRRDPVIRTMPNMAVGIGEGMTVLSPGAQVGSEELTWATELFRSVGRALVLEEQSHGRRHGPFRLGPRLRIHNHRVPRGRGPQAGLPRDVATELAAQTVLGAARNVLITESIPPSSRTGDDARGGDDDRHPRARGGGAAAHLDQRRSQGRRAVRQLLHRLH